MADTIYVNYEKYMNIISKEHKIKKIMKNIINNQSSNKLLDFNVSKDIKEYEFIIIKEKSKLYDSQFWFYPDGYDIYDNNFSIYPYQFHDISTATLFTLYKCGGVNSYLVTKDIKLLLVNQAFVKNIITNIIDPLLKNNKTKHKDYYKYVKMYLKNEYNLASSSDRNKIKQIQSKDIKGDSWTKYFLSYVSKNLGYNGLFFSKNEGLYNKVNNSIKIILNKNNLFVRDTKNKYDWTNWGIEDYILPINVFDLNINFFLYQNIGFKIYDFYKESLQISLKITEEYDFGTLNINSLISINKNFDKDKCMKGLIKFFKSHKLKFMCLQDIKYKDTKMFNKFINAENMYTSVGDFESQYFKDEDLCNIVISTSNIIILNNELLPGKREHFILFKHPNYRKKVFLNTKLAEGTNNILLRIEQLNRLKDLDTNYIIGNLNIVKGTIDYDELSSLGYALNSDQVYGTTINNIQTDYILSKLPKVMKSVVPINYKYSTHRVLIGKI